MKEIEVAESGGPCHSGDYGQLSFSFSLPKDQPHLDYSTTPQQTEMPSSVNIGSAAEFSKLLTTSTIVITDCKALRFRTVDIN